MKPSGLESMMNERFDIATQVRLALIELNLEDIDPETEAQSGEHSDQIMEWMNRHSNNFRQFLISCDPAVLSEWEHTGKEGLRNLSRALLAYEANLPVAPDSELLH